jgi:Holliday junction resolvase RusA-like endonuclease
LIILDLPIPISVNRSRKIDWAHFRAYKAWQEHADILVMASRQHLQKPINGPFQATITLNEKIRNDADNLCKAIFDYCARIKLIAGDGPAFLRKFTVQFGNAPEGVRIIIEEFDN